MQRTRSSGNGKEDSERTDDGSSVRSSRTARRDARPARTDQRLGGNQAVQRLAAERERNRPSTERESGETTDGTATVDGPPVGSVGVPLRGETRRRMERTLGADFGDVRVHDGVGATRANRTIGVDAYATGSDVVLAPDLAAVSAGAGRALLAHELAHVAQFENGRAADRAAGTTDRGEAAEREAARAGVAAVAGESVSVRETPSASVATGVWGWLEDRAADVGGAVGSAASSVGSTVSRGASAAWEGTKAAGSTVASGASRAASWVGDQASAAYEDMKWASGKIRQGGSWLEGKIDAGQDWVAGKARAAAAMAEGIPVLEQVADAGAWGVDQYTGLQAGVLQGATSFGSGLLGMAANPVDAAKGIFQMGKNVPTGIGALNPFKSAEAGYDLITGNASLDEYANRLYVPQGVTEQEASFWSKVGSGFVDPYERSIGEDGDYAQAVGRGVFDIGSLFLGGSGAVAKGGSTAGRVANVASKAGRASRGARIAGKADDVTRAVQSVSDDALRVSRGGVDDVQARITSSADEVMTTRKAMSQPQPVSAGSPWVKHKGKWVKRGKTRWHDESGQFAEGPYSFWQSGGTAASGGKSLDDIIARADASGSKATMSARRAEDFMTQTGKTRSGTPRVSKEWRSRYGPGTMEEHHLLPQEFLDVPAVRDRLSQVIKSRKSTPEDLVHENLARITKQRHIRLDKAGYAADWAKWFKRNPSFTKGQLQQRIKQMMDEYGIPESARSGLKRYGRN